MEAARYYENIPGYAHQAVMLYHKVRKRKRDATASAPVESRQPSAK